MNESLSQYKSRLTKNAINVSFTMKNVKHQAASLVPLCMLLHERIEILEKQLGVVSSENIKYVVRADSFGHTQILGVFDTKEDAKAFQYAYELNWDAKEKGYTPSLWVNEIKYNPELPPTENLETSINV